MAPKKTTTRKRATPGERAKQRASDKLASAANCLTVSDAATQCNVHTETVKRWIASGKLPAFKLGGHWRIRPEQVDAFLKAQGAA